MSIASPFDRVPSGSRAQSVKSLARRPVEATAFWVAVAVPLAYPALLFGGLGGEQFLVLLALLAVNVVALLLGRDYKRDAR